METADEFYLCSATVIEHLQPKIVSKPFRSGYDSDKDTRYYVAQFDYQDAKSYYKGVIEPFNEKSRVHCNFWFRTCSRGHIDVSQITMTNCRRLGLFVAIEQAVNLTQPQNIAIAIGELADKFNCSPIEFINKIA
ncbi:hypothetical protein FAES_1812 [Fibrella aestuarina BUZ 2]|uniref:Uncharacterized protein n=1 Tax=Fibrella aestuarina BUZ 2 TaxID=1166018 RepID=I0K6R9_9BACT|nr:hypothetical protein [Fibrella aestuarina]CCG99822.1 hypothetical protein FAES_1812 [Fibrella aestuarina BUZ 2]